MQTAIERRLDATPGALTGNLLRRLLQHAPVVPGVLVVTRPDMFPADHGAAVKVDRTAAALSQVVGPVYLVTDDRLRYYRYLNGKRETISFPLWLRIPGPLRPILNLRLRHAGIPRRDAFLYYALADWGLLLRAAYVAARTGVRIFQAEFPAYARVCLWVKSLLGGHTVLVEHNVEFDRLKAQIGKLDERRYELLRQIELTLCNRVDLVIAVSRLDRERLVRNGVDGDKIFVVPHGVDLAASDAAAGSRGFLVERGISSDRPIIVYHGTYAYPPNLDAIRILACEILPRLRVRGFQPLVLALGPHAPKTRSFPDVVFLGSVVSVPPYLKAADIAVVPLQQGGGTRMKILDYFAAGVPVVTTAKGAEGLDLVDGRDALIRDSYDSIADAVECLLRDRHRASALGARGRQFAAALDWLSIGQRYRDLFLARSMLPEDLLLCTTESAGARME